MYKLIPSAALLSVKLCSKVALHFFEEKELSSQYGTVG
jgi:hypothetical protein